MRQGMRDRTLTLTLDGAEFTLKPKAERKTAEVGMSADALSQRP